MGQYLHIGLCYNIRLPKEYMEKHSLSVEDMETALKASKFELNIYHRTEHEKYIQWGIDKELVLKGVYNFLLFQYEIIGCEKEHTEKTLARLKECVDFDSIVKLAEQQPSNFQYVGVYDTLRVKNWYDVNIAMDTIVFYAQGKIYMECYRDFLRYMENVMRLQSGEYPLTKAVKFFIQ